MTTRWQNPSRAGSALFLVSLLLSCKTREAPDPTKAHPADSVAGAGARADSPASATPKNAGAASGNAPGPAAEPPVAAVACPPSMVRVPGGEFWVGGDFNDDERPNFLALVHDFCLDRTEVTLEEYSACVQKGACTKAGTDRITCNQSRAASRAKHPVNCVDFRQASAHCGWRNARLPSEVEWEYAARGGRKHQRYSWGDEPPDDRTCWKQAGTCEVQSYPVGAFGLYDMTGNVWEWTSDWYGPYPWPQQDGHARVYRGGSWSRRFVKWLRPQLRNRYPEHQSGSHLGFRCALTPRDVECDRSADDASRCRRVVRDVKCQAGKSFNGARCARPGEPRCPAGARELAGHGCVREGAADPAEIEGNEVDTAGVQRSRSAEFDEDCLKHYPGRPRAYRYSGGNHAGRNAVSRKVGCKNRDVGAGWNSCCCPG